MTLEQTVYALLGAFALGLCVGFILGEHYGASSTMREWRRIEKKYSKCPPKS